MKQKLMVKYSLTFMLLAAVVWSLLGLPPGRVHADPPELTPSPAVDIRTRLQPYQTPGVEPAQSDGRLFEEAPLPSEVEEPPVGALAQQTFYAIADATVLQGYPSQNLGSTTDMWAGYDEDLEPDGRIARSLVRFDIASLPTSQVITTATLRVRLVTSWDYPSTSRTITTYHITASWSESNVTWNNRPGYGSAYGSRSIVHGAWGWYEFDVTNLVRAWYNGTYTNYGIMLRGPEVSGLDSSWRGFGTREGSYRPQLVVEYDALTPTSTSTATPTPTSTSTAATPTPTSTPQTPAPTAEWEAYLPIVMKNWSPSSLPPPPTSTPTSTPTATSTPPSPCPQTGSWSGTTNQGYSISFTVANTPSCQARSLSIRYRCTCTYGSITATTTFITPISISNNHFDTGGSNPRVIGNFASQTSASGTWSSSFYDPNLGWCSGSGTWTAS